MDAFDYLARRLVRQREAWEEEYRDLMRAVAVATALANRGKIRESDMETWARVHHLPEPELRWLFGRTSAGEWSYGRNGVWTFRANPSIQKREKPFPRRKSA